jgi:hypothetical protein
MLNIPTHNLSYMIGFLQGDGHHESATGNKGRVKVEISERDVDLLDKFERILEGVVKVSRSARTRTTNFKDNAKSVTLTVFDQTFRENISKFLPVGKKSEIVTPPIDLDGFSKQDYIRGLIDSDGSLGVTGENKPFISFCTQSEALKDFLINSISEVVGAEKRPNRNKRDNVYNICLFNEDAVAYAKYLYDGSETYLKRKYEKYQEMLSWVRRTPKRKSRPKTWLPSEDEVVKDPMLSLDQKVETLNRSKLSIRMRAWRLAKQK